MVPVCTNYNTQNRQWIFMSTSGIESEDQRYAFKSICLASKVRRLMQFFFICRLNTQKKPHINLFVFIFPFVFFFYSLFDIIFKMQALQLSNWMRKIICSAIELKQNRERGNKKDIVVAAGKGQLYFLQF